ncbi:solute carrier organic anion transporter family member 2B1 [Anguilla rostrata]|uniref:solute carrier organic anion transporter family member 2B1 n=1 Tax=Anguilla rostrata TaxID=7938 RepID=UPI0030CE8EF2
MTASNHRQLAPARCRSPFNNIKFFVFCHGLLQLGHLLLSGYLKSSVSTIERRYGFSSRTSGLLVAFNEVGNTVLIVFVSFLGSRVHRPRFIGAGGIIAGLAGLLLALPHFLSGPYKYSNIDNTTELCLIGSSPHKEPQNCTQREGQDHQAVLPIMLLGQLLLGIGCVPIQPFGISYIDDYAGKNNSPLYLGIVLAITTAGPAAGFILGSLMQRLYVDIDKPGTVARLTNNDPRWVGAWWLGFLVAAGFLFLVSIPYLFFPREMPKEESAATELEPEVECKVKEEVPKSDPLMDLSLGQFLRSFPKIVLRTLKNPIFLLVVLAQVNLAAVAAGVATFMAKFIEKQFTKTTSFSSIIIGGVNIPAATLGVLLGGAVTKRMRLSVKGMGRMCAVTIVLGILFAVPLLFLGCPSQSIAGIYPSRQQGPLKCSQNCACELETFDPVCGSNGVEYRSPCNAGCTVKIVDFSKTVKVVNYTDCSCVRGPDGSPGHAVHGMCGSRCSHLFIPFIIMSTLTCFVLPIFQTPSFMMILRTVKPEDKSFAVGVQFMLFRVLAFLPAPVIYGSAIDSACILWGKKCKSKTSCLYYDLDMFRQRFLGLLALFLCGGFSCILLAYLVLRRHLARQQTEREKGEDANANTSKLLLSERKGSP